MTREEMYRFGKAFVVSAIVFAIFSMYLFLRRGYFNLYIANKVFGSSAVLLASVTLVVGILSKRYTFFTSLMTIRRQLGLLALGFVVIHVILSLWQKNKFPFPEWYLNHWVSILFGITAIIIWLYLMRISKNSKIKKMGIEIWKRNLSLFSQVAFLAIFLHLTIMKYEGWIRWFKGQTKQTAELLNPNYPPASLFVFLIMIAVILFRLVARIRHKSPSQTPQPLPLQHNKKPELNHLAGGILAVIL